MDAPKLNLSHLLTRLGDATGREGALPFVGTVQPVAIVADLSMLASYLDAPEGVAAINLTTIAGNIRGFQLLSNAPGGTIILDWVSYNPGGGGAVDAFDYTYFIGPPNPAVAVPANVPTSMNPRRPVFARYNGYFDPASYGITINDGDHAYMGGSVFTTKMAATPMRGPIFIPPGTAFIIEAFAASYGIRGHVHFRELPGTVTD